MSAQQATERLAANEGGIARAAAVHLFPQVELFVIYAVMAMVLAFRPYGLFTQAQPRKI